LKLGVVGAEQERAKPSPSMKIDGPIEASSDQSSSRRRCSSPSMKIDGPIEADSLLRLVGGGSRLSVDEDRRPH